MSHLSNDPSPYSKVNTAPPPGPMDPTHAKYRWTKELAHLDSPVGRQWLENRKPDYSLGEYLKKPIKPNATGNKAPINPIKEAAKAVVTLAASTAGFALGGLPLALVAGCLAGGSLSAIDSRLTEGAVDWGRTALDGALGAIPAGWRYGSRLAAFAIRGTTGTATVLRGVVQGALDGGLLAALATGLKGAWNQTQAEGWHLDQWNIGKVFNDTVIAAGWGATGGALTGGALGGLYGVAPKANPLNAFANQAMPDGTFSPTP
jgi:hypothetical protein